VQPSNSDEIVAILFFFGISRTTVNKVIPVRSVVPLLSKTFHIFFLIGFEVDRYSSKYTPCENLTDENYS
jgi:hypothetical protein